MSSNVFAEVQAMMAAVADTTSVYEAERSKARTDAVAAIAHLEALLEKALGGERLRDLPNLNPISRALSEPFRGARLRGEFDRAIYVDGREKSFVALSEVGVLVRVNVDVDRETRRVTFHASPLEHDELLLEDLDNFLSVLSKVLPAHIAKCRQTTDKFIDVQRLATRVLQIR